MALFKKKKIEDRIKAKWQAKRCSFDALTAMLDEAELIELWVRHQSTYFQLGTSSDYDRERGFFAKVYYLNLKTDEELFPLLNGEGELDGFALREDFASLSALKMVNGLSLQELWGEAEIVGVDGSDPGSYTWQA